jgi:hypothetical protein
MPWAYRGSPVEPQLFEPPWYGPVCPVVWEGSREAILAVPYPDLSAPAAARTRT